MATAPAAVQYAVFDPQSLADPYPGYALLHAEAPVYHDTANNIFVVTKYDDVRRVVMHPELFSSQIREMLRQHDPRMRAVEAVYKAEGWERVDTLSMSDPPTHTRYRSMVANWFTPGKMRGAEAHVDAVVTELLDALIPAGRMDFMADFAVPMPIRVFAVQLGVPRGEMDLFQRFGDAGIEAISMIIPPDRELELARIGVEEQKYFAAKIEAYRAKPADLLISDLANARDENDELYTTAELLSIIAILVLGGNETTTNALATALWLMMATPGLEQQMRAEPQRIDLFIEEALRYLSPVQGVFRVAAQDTELGGVAIPKGARVLIKFGAANRDAGNFQQADDFDPLRAAARRHLAFGAGIKHCIGAPLARLEMKVAFRRILERVENIRPADPGFQPRFVPNMIVYGMKDLPIAFDRR